MKAMILAAGKGTRLKPYTDHKPKAMVEINGITMLGHQINYLTYYGVDEIIINVHHFPGQIKDFIRNQNYKIRIEFSDEQDELLDTGGGLKKASWFFDDGKPFFLVGVDIFTNLNLESMYNHHLRHNPLATLAVKKRDSTRDFLIDQNNVLCGWKNNITGEQVISRKSETGLTNIGFSVVHVIHPRIFSMVTETGPFTLTSLYLRLAGDHTILAYPHNNDQWFEFGRTENLLNENLLSETLKIQQLFL
ncbi:MAG: nucleotidyltransferase family protein [Bacteroidales bacterium]|nr:nucleotidyltransferase family protein [Bacteroidales bacterium]